MKIPMMLRTALLVVVCSAAAVCADTTVGSFVVSNDDLGPPFPNTLTFFGMNADGTLGAPLSVDIGGNGIGGGFFAAKRVIVVPNAGGACVFASNGMDADIVGVDAGTHAVTGAFYGSPSDSGTTNGIGLVANTQYLYASFTATSTIGTFTMQPGCSLTFVGDVFAAGLDGGVVDGMAVQGNMMVVTYGDGSIESFNISGGVPVSNGDQQYSTGSADDHLPNGVDITHNGHYAVFGDASTRSNVEVADISSGKLAPSVAYDLGTPWNSSAVRLSPDEKLLFVTNDSVGQVSVAFFDNTTGKVRTGCTSPSLKGFYTRFAYTGGVVFQTSSGSGGLIYVPEFSGSGKQLIGVLQFTPNGASCTLTETANSPVVNSNQFAYVLSLAAYPAAQ